MFGRRRTHTTAPVATVPATTAAPLDDPYATRTVAVRESRSRALAGATAAGVGAGFHLIARLVLAAGALIALLIALAILLRDVGANPHNSVVSGVHDAANFFAGSFTGLTSHNGHPKRAITIDWGIALVVYLLVAAMLAGLIARVGRAAAGLGGRGTTRVPVAPTY